MVERATSILRKALEPVTPDFIRLIIKRLYLATIRTRNKYLYIKRGKRAELGYRFRFERQGPHKAYIGERTITEEFNVWNANVGDIIVGKNCWFGLHNIVMGPVEIGNNVSTGPYVCVLGPRHAVQDAQLERRDKTIIGNNVWISTCSLILFGVRIGDNAIVGPGAVVTKDVAANAFVAGNPARDITRIAQQVWKAKNSESASPARGE